MEFKSVRSYDHFRNSVNKSNRYIFDPDVDDFLAAVRATAKKRTQEIPADRALWRAQIGSDWEPITNENGVEYSEGVYPYGAKRMKPLKGQQSPGRVNAENINCLYLAIDQDTAIAEVRPWVGSDVSVALFKNPSPLHIVTCVNDGGLRIYLPDTEPPPEKREESVWSWINWHFSMPIGRDDNPVDYVPTQILSELFKNEGYDGVAYKSSVGPGHNLALFNLESVEFVRSELHLVKKVVFETDRSG